MVTNYLIVAAMLIFHGYFYFRAYKAQIRSFKEFLFFCGAMFSLFIAGFLIIYNLAK